MSQFFIIQPECQEGCPDTDRTQMQRKNLRKDRVGAFENVPYVIDEFTKD